ncbi:HIT domain-containing protein [Spiroplasma endosymbiont of Aspidapion aeneum]|uniref:HIT domain-containing protein n=1 Tax=Spiroplasma endosymbiont of Aspidapion aeneum TaxID=3066276 RepID=UPI00313F1C1D
MNDCLFCNIINKQMPANIIYEDEWTMALLDISPVTVGHTLVIPKKHSNDLISTDEDMLTRVSHTRKRVALLLKNKLKPKGFNFTSNNGSEAFQVVFHYHEHIIPKYEKELGLIYKLNKDGTEKKPLTEVLKIITK